MHRSPHSTKARPCGATSGLKQILICVIALLSSGVLRAQGTSADYERAEKMKVAMNTKVYCAPSRFSWQAGKEAFWYARQTPKGKEFVLVNAQKRSRKPAFDQQKLAKELTAALGKPVDAYNLPFNEITFAEEGKALEFIVDGTKWRTPLGSYKLQNLGKAEERNNRYWGDRWSDVGNKPVLSPDKKWEALIKNHNVYIRSVANKKEEYQLSFDGSAGEYYSSNIEWSPDSKKLATNRVRPNKEHLLYLLESSPLDQLQPKLHTRNYLKPGDALPQRAPQLFLVDERRQVPVDPALFGMGQQYDLSNPNWRKSGQAFTVEYNQRGHQVYKVLEVNAETGKVRDLIKEESKTFLDYSGKRFRQDIADGKEIIWTSERDGWNHLYLYDGQTGQVKNQITKGDWVVRRVVHVDEKNRSILFEGSGREAGQDPYLVQYYRVKFDGTGLTALTSENAHHAGTFSSDFRYFVDTYSRVDVPSVTVLRSATDGKVVMELEKADASELQKTGWKAPEVFTAKARDGKTDIWGILVRPTNFDPAKTYPVIEYIYAGPHSSFVPKTFNSGSRHMQELAELGFVVVQLDGMGTSNRSKAFQDVAWKNIKDAGFPDRIAWMKAAAQKYPSLDLTRVGIFGTSAGGQSSAGALLFHPEFYKVAVSSAGCHDNRMDKMWWNEQWMGFPIGPEYAASSNVVNAHKLQGKLMLVLGEMDDNVDPASTLQLVDALIKANKNFDFLMVPGMGHSSGGDYGEHKRRDFFVKHLLGLDPPAWQTNNQEKI
ncbi:DPP IV N-terminal domain-containing protein [Rufibacter sediminis]|uniref:DPP IV N-terminal domain-containing protein n=1 Tax=Rufibacter sediminis TaxID=2762756 RepID=A0ABR6VSJ3_9BACT|nr:S9 family peptidase [Rufibacter sediminis]MBC3540134.1 DPP IV N-terminal domain-containing protein [Rufibacter sediminis]